MPAARTLPLSARPGEVIAFLALCLGAVAMGVSPIFVRIADVGPFASAFWRVALAVPVLAIWAISEGGRGALVSAFRSRAIWLAGFFFSIDLFFWHLSILHTSIANATFLSSMAPIWVLLFSGLFIGEKVGRREAGGVIVCILGGAVLLGGSYTLDSSKLIGDIYGVGTSFGFGTYFLAVRAARREHSTGTVTFGATTVTALCLGIIAFAFEPKLLPSSLAGAATLAALAYISHIGGQGLLAFALGYLSAAFSSLVIFMEVIAAAALAFLVFGEAIGWSQAAGGLMILGGIWIARPRS